MHAQTFSPVNGSACPDPAVAVGWLDVDEPLPLLVPPTPPGALGESADEDEPEEEPEDDEEPELCDDDDDPEP
jgi:hypothetical protein